MPDGSIAGQDPASVWRGLSPYTGTVGATNTADQAISLAIRIPLLEAGKCECIALAYVLNPGDLGAALDATTGLKIFAKGIDISDTLSVSVCDNEDSVELVIDGTDGYTWHWSPPYGLSDTVGDTVYALIDTTIVYHVTGISRSCDTIYKDIYHCCRLICNGVYLSGYQHLLGRFGATIFEGHRFRRTTWYLSMETGDRYNRPDSEESDRFPERHHDV